MKVFVLGSSGMLGRYVDKYFRNRGYDVVSITRKELDASLITEEDIYSIGIAEDDVVINCIGLIKQRKEVKDVDFLLVNSLFPRMMADVCEKIGVKFIHVTTDCVFSGSKGNYTETSAHDADDLYGRSKSLGEPKNATVIRTSIIGEERNNFLSLLEWVKSQAGNVILGFTNHYWNGITCLQFAKICEKIIKGYLFWRGVRHIHSPNAVSKYDLVKMISDIYNLKIEINKHETPEKCDRTIKSEFKESALEVIPLYEQLIETKEFKL